MRKVGIGIVGSGVISPAYINASRLFPDIIEIKGIADMRTDVAERRGAEFGIPAMRVDQMLKRDDIEIIVNLTVPLAHTDVDLVALRAGKNVYSEKPLGISLVEAKKVMDLANEKGLRVGCAPDTLSLIHI